MFASNLLKSMVPQFIKKPLKDFMGFISMDSRLKNLRNAGFNCLGAVDVGAFHGDWTRSLRQVWNVPVIAVEPQPGCIAVLGKLASDDKSIPIYFETCALGREVGFANFHVEETNSRIAEPEDSISSSIIEVPISTLQKVLAAHDGTYNLLKVDVQGFELEVLEGAADTLSQFEVIILEVSIIRIGPVPTFYEVMQYMDSKGYRLYDFLPMYYRPLDNALWQGDAFFVRNDSSLVSSLNWD